MIRDPIERFMSYVHPEPNSGCWLWRGSFFENAGYPRFSETHKLSVGAHRYSWRIHRGPIPPKMEVCHKCDVRGCVNPDHLFLGTPQQNTDDKVNKQRHARGSRLRPDALSEEVVLEIKKNGNLSINEVAERFGTSYGVVYNIRRGLSWGWLV